MKFWPHAPSHVVNHPGTYMITAGTVGKEHFFNTPEKLELLEEVLLTTLEKLGWKTQAWAVFPNHYHVVDVSPNDGLGRRRLTGTIHGNSARLLNRLDECVGRSVWYRSWDSCITFEKSYLARLAYVHNNPVKHGLVSDPEEYRWCSASWFASRSERRFYETVTSFKTESVNVFDDF